MRQFRGVHLRAKTSFLVPGPLSCQLLNVSGVHLIGNRFDQFHIPIRPSGEILLVAKPPETGVLNNQNLFVQLF